VNTQNPKSPSPQPSPGVPGEGVRLRYFRALRLTGKLAFAAVYEAAASETRGPLKIFSLPNKLPHPRMGLSVSRRVGTAPRRNRIKRMLRESFRSLQHDWAAGYDLVIVVRPHAPLSLAEYQKLLSAMIARIHKRWNAVKGGQ
jgi:ribonuclease P protein component